VSGEQVFDPAAIERKPPGHEMKTSKGDGWAWPELKLIDESQGGAPKEQRDALALLAVMMQHTDNKPDQQRLLCLPGSLKHDGVCEKPFMFVHDVGNTFGSETLFNSSLTSSANFAEWSKTPVWRDSPACVGHMSKSYTGTLGDPKIGDAGRKFLADLLDQLTDRQLHDLFDVAHVDRRRLKVNDAEPAASVDQWVDAFKRKRTEIDLAHCPER
jgi:hypothetical protein